MSSADFEDLYAVLGVAADASVSEISRAYRKQAIALHPDKQTGKSDSEQAAAAALFERVTRARDTLVDVETRANFDALLAARRQRATRDLQRDAAQRDMLERLVRREADARAELVQAAERAAREQFDQDVNRLRLELRRHEASREARRRAREQEIAAANQWQQRIASTCLRVAWSEEAGVLSERLLRDVFGQYGDVEAVLMSRGGKRDALVSFASPAAAATALADLEADDTFAVAWADADGALQAAAAVATAATGAPLQQVAAFEPYRAPQHADVVGGVRLPQTPHTDNLDEHLAYERAVLQLLQGARPAAAQ